MRKRDLMDGITNMIEYMIGTNKEIVDVMITDDKGIMHSFYSQTGIGQYLNLKEEVDFTAKSFKKPVIATTFGDQSAVNYYYISSIYDSDDYLYKNKIGTVIILFQQLNVKEMFKNIKGSSDAVLLLLNNKQEIIESTNPALIGSNIHDRSFRLKNYKNSEYLNINQSFNEVNWELRAIIPRENITYNLTFFRNMIYITGLIMILLLLGIALIVNQNITRPLTYIINSIKKIRNNPDKKRISEEVKGEMGIITVEINELLDEIENMTGQVLNTQKKLYETEINRKQSDLAALQSQINPHFLYNTLECMKNIGITYNVKEVEKIANAMAVIFRYSIKGDDLTLIEDEIKIIKEYMTIMNIRFRDKFNISYQIEEKLLMAKIPKMILQPVVENAIYHGLEQVEKDGELLISGSLRKEDETVIFEINDNGIGISQKMVKELNEHFKKGKQYSQEKEHNSIGLDNINQKIKLMLGEEYGLSIYSKKGEGTTVRIIIPYRQSK